MNNYKLFYAIQFNKNNIYIFVDEKVLVKESWIFYSTTSLLVIIHKLIFFHRNFGTMQGLLLIPQILTILISEDCLFDLHVYSFIKVPDPNPGPGCFTINEPLQTTKPLLPKSGTRPCV